MRKLFFSLFLLTATLFAHKVNLFITHENDLVDIYSYFASGDPCNKCKIIIKQDGKTLLEDQLNDKGKYQYKAMHEKLTVVIDASSGHMVQKDITLHEMPQEDLAVVLKQENENEHFKIVISLLLIGLIFYMLKRIKRYAK